MCLLASVYLLWKNVDLDLLHIFKLSFLFFWHWSMWAVYNFWILTSTEWEKIFANVSLFFSIWGTETLLWWWYSFASIDFDERFCWGILFPHSYSTWHAQLHLLNLHSLYSSILVDELRGGHLAQIQTHLFTTFQDTSWLSCCWTERS